MSCSVDRVSYEQNGRGNDLPSKLLVFSRWFTVRRQHCIANYRTKTAKVIQTGARPKNALFTIKLSMKLSWSQASGLLATSYSISQSKKLYFSLGFRFSEISAVPFVLWSANPKNRFFPLSQSLYWRPPADQKASGLWVRDCSRPRFFVFSARLRYFSPVYLLNMNEKTSQNISRFISASFLSTLGMYL